MTGSDDRDRPYYGPARRIIGVGCFALAAGLMVIDAFTPFDLDIARLGLILGTGLLALGVDRLQKFIDR
jgi:hypothetical protein